MRRVRPGRWGTPGRAARPACKVPPALAATPGRKVGPGRAVKRASLAHLVRLGWLVTPGRVAKLASRAQLGQWVTLDSRVRPGRCTPPRGETGDVQGPPALSVTPGHKVGRAFAARRASSAHQVRPGRLGTPGRAAKPACVG